MTCWRHVHDNASEIQQNQNLGRFPHKVVFELAFFFLSDGSANSTFQEEHSPHFALWTQLSKNGPGLIKCLLSGRAYCRGWRATRRPPKGRRMQAHSSANLMQGQYDSGYYWRREILDGWRGLNAKPRIQENRDSNLHLVEGRRDDLAVILSF